MEKETKAQSGYMTCSRSLDFKFTSGPTGPGWLNVGCKCGLVEGNGPKEMRYGQEGGMHVGC